MQEAFPNGEASCITSDILFQKRLHRGRGDVAEIAARGDAVSKDDDIGDGHDAVAHRRRLVLVHVDLDERRPARHLARDAVEHGREHPAGTAPARPEIAHHGTLFDQFLELLARNFHHVL